MSRPNGERYSCPLQSLIVSPFTFRIHSCLSSDWRRSASLKFFDTQLLVPSKNLCSLVFCCSGHWFVVSLYLIRTRRIENFSFNACKHCHRTPHLIMHCSATDSASLALWPLCLYDLWSRPWGVARLLGLHDLLPCLHSLKNVW